MEATLERARAPRPRRITSRTTSGPISSASAAKSAQRARSSRHVVPDAPTASVGGGAGDTDAEREDARRASARRLRSRASARCSPSRRRGERRARPRRTRRPRSAPSPRARVPSGASTSIAFEVIVTGWLKRSRTSVGGVSTRDCVTGSELMRVTCASAADGARSAHEHRDERGRRLRLTGRPPEAAEDGSRVPIGEEEHGEQHERQREARRATQPCRGRSAWPSGKSATTTSIQPIAWWRNADRE